MARRYAGLLGVQARSSALLAMQYRVEFGFNAAMSFVWTATAIAPLLVLYASRSTVAGWTRAEALVVVGFFTLLKGVLDGAVQPSLADIVERIRTGTLDFVLLKPADAQFLVSTSRFDLWKSADVLGGILVIAYALRAAHHVPSAMGFASAAVLLCGAVLILYSLWILVVSLAFLVVRVDNLTYLFASIYDAARWPSSVYRGALAVVFTFVIPLSVMTTYPALALLNRLAPARCATALCGAVAFSLVARTVWSRAIRRYTSAGG